MQEYSDQELRRLAKLYAVMSDGELEQLAADAESLTDAARSALQIEMDHRGMRSKPGPSLVVEEEGPVPLSDDWAGTTEVECRELVTVGRFGDLAQASLARGFLESAGIETFLIDENIAQLSGLGSAAYGGIKLQVSLQDVEEAVRLLAAQHSS
jgi:hypothetical protein